MRWRYWSVAPFLCFHVYPVLDVIYCTTYFLTLNHWVPPVLSTYRSKRASIVMILHSMRIPLFLCISSSDQHCIHPPIDATIMYHHLYMYWSNPMFRSLISLFILLTLLWAWVCTPHPYTCLTLYVSHPFFRTIKKPKSTIVQTTKLHFSMGLSSISTVVTIIQMILWCLSAIQWALSCTHQGEIC